MQPHSGSVWKFMQLHHSIRKLPTNVFLSLIKERHTGREMPLAQLPCFNHPEIFPHKAVLLMVMYQIRILRLSFWWGVVPGTSQLRYQKSQICEKLAAFLSVHTQNRHHKSNRSLSVQISPTISPNIIIQGVTTNFTTTK